MKRILLASTFLVLAACTGMTPEFGWYDYYGIEPLFQQPYEVYGIAYRPMSPQQAQGYRERGTASWYGDDFHGKLTSTGETYDMYEFTAAHKLLPLGVYVRVTNLRNGRQSIVRLNDRGPFVSDRIIDLSYSTAKELDMVGDGLAPVEVEVLGFPLYDGVEARLPSPGTDRPLDIMIRVASYRSRENAERMLQRVSGGPFPARIVEFRKERDLFYRVVINGFRNSREAEGYCGQLRAMGVEQPAVVAE